MKYGTFNSHADASAWIKYGRTIRQPGLPKRYKIKGKKTLHSFPKRVSVKSTYQ